MNEIIQPRILLCEDDESLGMLLREYLEAKGYSTVLCADGQQGLETYLNSQFTLCILDVMMPHMDGFTLAEKIKEVNPEAAFIFLTAKTMKEDVRKGFELGADDYITKPFSMEEVVFRIDAILRRLNGKKSTTPVVRQLGRFTFDTNKQTLLLNDTNTEIKLTTKETDLLKLLSDKVNDLLPRDYALKVIWSDDNYFNARSMDVYITKLRKILKDDPDIEILNVHGKGYKLVVK